MLCRTTPLLIEISAIFWMYLLCVVTSRKMGGALVVQTATRYKSPVRAARVHQKKTVYSGTDWRSIRVLPRKSQTICPVINHVFLET